MADLLKYSAQGAISVHGHRGARGLYPENTVTACVGAAKLGVHAVEVDVVISQDHEVVVSHEAWMNSLLCLRPDGKAVEDDPEKYNLYGMPYSEIKTYDCGQRAHPDFRSQLKLPEHKPLLRDVITSVEELLRREGLPPVIYNIEIKTEWPDGKFNPPPALFVDLVAAEIQKAGLTERVHLQSFDVRILQEVKKRELPVSIGYLVETKDGLEAHLGRLGFIPHVFSPEYNLLSEEGMGSIRQLGMQCIPWTVNDVRVMQMLLRMGVDGLITDYPDKALALLEQKK